MTRTTVEGTPAGRLAARRSASRSEAALRHFTRDAAYASFEEQERGILADGRLADLVVLSDDLLRPRRSASRTRRCCSPYWAARTRYRAREF